MKMGKSKRNLWENVMLMKGLTLGILLVFSAPGLTKELKRNTYHLDIETTALDFDVKGKITGYAKLVGDVFKTSKLRVKFVFKSADGEKVYLTQTGMGLRDQHTAEYLGYPKFNELIISGVKGQLDSSGKKGKGAGKMTIKGITKPVKGSFTYNKKKKLICAQFTIKPSQWGIVADYKLVKMKDKVVGKACIPVK
jgi:hypothetical protein